jgi:hypothetical protein
MFCGGWGLEPDGGKKDRIQGSGEILTGVRQTVDLRRLNGMNHVVTVDEEYVVSVRLVSVAVQFN